MPDSIVLIVDDRESDHREARWTLQDVGIPDELIHWARTPDEAVALCKEHHPKTILMDINLGPEHIDGIELTRRLKAMNGFEIVVLTTSDTDDDVDRAFDAGAVAYIEKTEGEVFEASMEAYKEVFRNGHFCPPSWRDRFVRIADKYLEQ